MESQNVDLSKAFRSRNVPVMVKSSHVWTIHNFSVYNQEMKKDVRSASFFTAPDNKIKWFLKLTSFEDYNDIRYYSLFVYVFNNSEDDIVTECVGSVLNSKNEVLCKLNLTHKFCVNYDYECCGWKKFIKETDLLEKPGEWLPGDKLTILGELNITTMSEKAEVVQFSVPQCNLLDDFEMLYKSQKLSDVTICVEGTEFRAHKAILAARSPVFMAMFEHEMKERENSRVDITDIHYEVMNELLRFIYTGKATNLKTLAHGLFFAADKYALERLKLLCERELCSNLCKENVVEMIIFADMHNAKELKVKATNFVSTHAAEVMDTPEWKTTMIEHLSTYSESLTEVLQQVSKKKKCY